jgi:hypothetical protein
LDEGLKRGVYVAFEPEQKQMFWIEKIHEILLLDWNEPEKSHIEVLYQTVLDNPHWFTKDRTEKEYEEYDLFQYKWIEYAKEQLAWSDRQIASIAATGNKVLDKNGKIQINNTAPRLKSGVECDCNVSINICFPKGCLAKEYSNCIEKSIGCGLLFLAPCNGLCTSL